jgi:hypothetical protein
MQVAGPQGLAPLSAAPVVASGAAPVEASPSFVGADFVPLHRFAIVTGTSASVAAAAIT